MTIVDEAVKDIKPDTIGPMSIERDWDLDHDDIWADICI